MLVVSMRELDRLLHKSCNVIGAYAMISEAALREKNEECLISLANILNMNTLKFCYILFCSIVKEGIALNQVVKFAAYKGCRSGFGNGKRYTGGITDMRS